MKLLPEEEKLALPNLFDALGIEEMPWPEAV